MKFQANIHGAKFDNKKSNDVSKARAEKSDGKNLYLKSPKDLEGMSKEERKQESERMVKQFKIWMGKKPIG